jgi:hypothetical protein
MPKVNVRVLELYVAVAADPGASVVAAACALFLKSTVLASEVAAALALAEAADALEEALDAEVAALEAEVAAACAWYLALNSPPATGPSVLVAQLLAESS